MKIISPQRNISLAVVALCLFWLQWSYAQESSPDSRKSLETTINTILKDTLLKSSFVGIKIISVDNGSVLYERDSKKLFHPASNIKILTTAAAIHYLKSNFSFSTTIYTDGKITDSILLGNLYIQGRGDPLLTTADFDTLAIQIKHRGISAITGKIVGDISYFDTVSWGHGWMWDDEPQVDEAFISPLSVNRNAIMIHASGGIKEGDSISFWIDPQTLIATIINHGITTTDTSVQKLHALRPPQSNRIALEGCLQPNETYDLGVSIFNPAQAFLHLFKERLESNGIRIETRPSIGSNHGRIIIAEIFHPIDSVLHRANKMSDNLAAENLLKTLAAECVGTPGTTSAGILLIKQYLTTAGIDTSILMIADGSGVSWYNEVTPDALVRLLRHQFLHRKTFTRFYESLAIAGYDGTIKNRMNGTRAALNVHAKTGSLNGVSCISGYITTADNRLLAFSILCNQFPYELRLLRNIQDKILESIANSSIGTK